MPLNLSPRSQRLLVLLARAVVAGVFVWAAVPKLLDPAGFASDVANYHLLPESWAGATATIVPALELVIAVALLTGWGARGAALAALGMLLVFTIAIGQAMARGIDIDCGCFGEESSARADVGSLVRNVLLMAACLVALLGPEVRFPWGAAGRARAPVERDLPG